MEEIKKWTIEEINGVPLSRSVTLYTPADIVRHSLFVQDSITALNLELCQDYTVCEGETEPVCGSYSNEIIITEEKFRRILAKRRRLLNTFHLDLPRYRERSLRGNIPQSINMEINSIIFREGFIKVDERFYPNVLFDFIDYSCQKESNFKVLKWLITCEYLDNFVRYRMPIDFINYFIDCMHSGLDDLKFVTCFLRKIDLRPWLRSREPLESGRLKKLVYQISRIPISDFNRFVDSRISLPLFQFAREILKLQSAPSFVGIIFSEYLHVIRDERVPKPLFRINLNVSRQRNCLLFQVFWLYFTMSNTSPESSKFLRLMWNSVPDSFLSFREITTTYLTGFSSEEAADVYKFYSETVGAPVVKQISDSFVEPRSLKHYCRTSIRSGLEQARCYLPDGINELGLPKLLQSYLNLE